MPAVVLTSEDERLIAELLERYDPERNPGLARLADKMPAPDWAFFVTHTRRDFRDTAYVSMLAKASIRAAYGRGLADRAGIKAYLSSEAILVANFGRGWHPESERVRELSRYNKICGAFPDKIRDERDRIECSVLSDVVTRFEEAIREAILADVLNT